MVYIESRVIDERHFLNLLKTDDGHVIGKLIRIHPTGESAEGVHQATGTYTEYITSVCSSSGEAEMEVHAILVRIGAKPGSFDEE
ncbi:hypothetical protein MJA45_18955 [Paenibacillus aurantius]|uniref:Uncharacterized protein n=1 Tax=Paenibacillus aurantius TaxID=2918900 RepID=A0AA96LAS1_9BACL|nr:hypothetical protein [Paenibacillus aurantius]WNQ09694.1 hypothetical protein MJA45_18955 [Paenibacillus aurantius]